MGWFFSKEKDIKESADKLTIHHALTLAFNHVRNDINNLSNWIRFFHEKHQHHEDRLARIEQQLASIPKSHEDIKRIIDYNYSYDSLANKIKDLHERIIELESKKQEQNQEKTSGLKERLMKKISRNSKEYIKTAILSMVKKYSNISGSQLKDIIVDEQGLCSKSSFYRLLADLEVDDEINSAQSGKEKIYSAKNKVLN